MANTPRFETIGAESLATATTVIAWINTLGYTDLSIQATDGDGGTFWSSAAVGVKWANSRDSTPVDFDTAKNITAPNTGVILDVSGVANVALVVDTAQSGVKGRFHICLKDNRGQA